MSKQSRKQKKYAKKLPALANHHIHNIPINLMESIGFHPIATSATSALPTTPTGMQFGQVPQAAMHNNMIPYHPAYFLNPLSYYWPLYGQPNFSNSIVLEDSNAIHEVYPIISVEYHLCFSNRLLL